MAINNNREMIEAGFVKVLNEKTPSLSFENDYFDYLLLNNVVYFWTKNEISSHLSELYRILKKNSRLIIYMTAKKHLELRTGKKDDIFNKHSTTYISNKLDEAGFQKPIIRKVGRKNGEYGYILNSEKP